MATITFLPILAAGVVSAVIGFVWYHPRVFGTVWMRLANITPEMAERGKKKMHLLAFIALLGSMLAAYVLRYFVVMISVYNISGAVQLAFLFWIGFIAPAMLGIVLWEQKPVTLYLINSVYWLVALISMSIILLY